MASLNSLSTLSIVTIPECWKAGSWVIWDSGHTSKICFMLCLPRSFYCLPFDTEFLPTDAGGNPQHAFQAASCQLDLSEASLWCLPFYVASPLTCHCWLALYMPCSGVRMVGSDGHTMPVFSQVWLCWPRISLSLIKGSERLTLRVDAVGLTRWLSR